MDTVFLKNHQTGEVREVEAKPEVLSPLMAVGWHQHFPVEKPVAPAEGN